jgi:WD40 repeat protein
MGGMARKSRSFSITPQFKENYTTKNISVFPGNINRMACRGEKLLLTGVLVLLCIGAAHGATLVSQWNESIPGISGLALAEDGSRVIVGTNTGHVFVYDGNGTVCWEKRVPGTVQAGILHNGSAYLVASLEDHEKNKGTLRLFDGDGEEVWFWNSGWIMAMDFCQGTDRIVTGDPLGNVIMLDGGGVEVRRWNDLPKRYCVADLTLSSDGKYFAYALEEPNPQVKFVTMSSGAKSSFKKYFTYTDNYGYLEPIRQIEIAGDGAYVATAGGEGSHGVLNFYARNGTCLWSKDISRINDLKIDSAGGCVFTACGDGNISCYNRSGSLEWVYPSGAPVESLSYARGGSLLAAGNDNGDLLLFNRSGELVWEDTLDLFPTGAVSRVDLSSDGSALAVVANNRYLGYFVAVPDPVPVVETPAPTVTEADPGKRNETPATPAVTRTPEPEPEETKEADLFGFLSGIWNFSFPKLW